ncbi:hypothetical protein ACPUER_11915 [Burkholderia sp. DN3021]|uniref:hypothetical protein n=1 Tax=Burkholderia sp. DN3021 TaxID=3410137 RepID=UPI003C7D4685
MNPKTGRKNVQGSPRQSHFAKLSQTPEGRAQLAEWRARRGTKRGLGRPHGALDGTTTIEREKSIAAAKAEAKRLVQLMEQSGSNIPKDGFAREALETAVEIVRRKEISPKDQLAAARLVLEFTMAKPASESNVTVKKAEDFLADLATQDKDDE